MKIACIFTGRIDGYDINYNNIMDNIIQGNEVDFYLATDTSLEQDLTGFIRLYKPKKVLIAEQDIYFDYYKYNTIHHVGTRDRSMYFTSNKYNVFQLINKEKEYDIIIFYRLDYISINKFDYSILTNLDDSTIYIPSYDDHCGVNDRMAIGSYGAMKKYTDLHVKLEEVLEMTNRFHPETMLNDYLNYIRMNIIRFNLVYHKR